MLSCRRLFLLCVSFIVFGSRVHADVIFLISEINGNVRIDYSGTLDMTGVSFSEGNNASGARFITTNIPSFGSPFTFIANENNAHGPRPDLRAYSNPFSSGPNVPYYSGLSNRAATLFGGQTIGLPTISIRSNATLRFDPLDFVGNVWTGSGFLQWNNTTVAGMGCVLVAAGACLFAFRRSRYRHPSQAT